MQHGVSPPHQPHPCLARGCRHSPEAHVATPELAALSESVVWCTECRHHEVRRRTGSVFGFGARRAARSAA